MTILNCDYAGEEFTVEADFAQASSPIFVNGEQIGYQVADARHKYRIAVAIAANHIFSLGLPECPTGRTPAEWEKMIIEASEWDNISYAVAEEEDGTED